MIRNGFRRDVLRKNKCRGCQKQNGDFHKTTLRFREGIGADNHTSISLHRFSFRPELAGSSCYNYDVLCGH